MPLQLDANGGAYILGIDQLRLAIQNNGRNPVFSPVEVSHHLAPELTVTMYINLAFEPDADLPLPNASVWTVAFHTVDHGVFRFDIPGLAFPAAWQVFPGHPDGSYGSLDCGNDLPAITDENLFQAVNTVRTYHGQEGGQLHSVKRAMARLIIAVNEAARFNPVRDEVNRVLTGSPQPYAPDHQHLHWSNRVLG